VPLLFGSLPRDSFDLVCRMLQNLVRRSWQRLGQCHEVRPGIDAEDKANVPGGVLTVKVLGLGEVGVTTEEERTETGLLTQTGRLGQTFS
jgi:hypothetical protein